MPAGRSACLSARVTRQNSTIGSRMNGIFQVALPTACPCRGSPCSSGSFSETEAPRGARSVASRLVSPPSDTRTGALCYRGWIEGPFELSAEDAYRATAGQKRLILMISLLGDLLRVGFQYRLLGPNKLFGTIPDSCSASSRNGVRHRPEYALFPALAYRARLSPQVFPCFGDLYRYPVIAAYRQVTF